MATLPDIRVGCCGFPMARAAYFRRFRLVEVQQTFYQPPRLETLARWRAEAGAGFEFTLKAWQLITHEPASPTYRRLTWPIPEALKERYGSFRPTQEVMEAWRITATCARALQARIVVFQCPASFGPTEEHIAHLIHFFQAARAGHEDLVFAWEPRGPWPEATVAGLCRKLELVHVVDPFQAQPAVPGLRYYRLHGIGGSRYRYGDRDLERLAQWCEGRTYCLFNNVAMADDAARFARLLGNR
ncbi:DUF72 domain-containing protein [Pelomicrobium sp.]|jgi:uncharacterized protein YecE (DUF72 family)|uniref:DUF72 domain-containing protein n=1 Tax=Pelomicrobium sp. TaxID=2815319 RepID=UPI002FDE39F7